MSHLKKAELIEEVVYVASPLRIKSHEVLNRLNTYTPKFIIPLSHSGDLLI
jgi:hypothetical protein